jgi:hypothetical protein
MRSDKVPDPRRRGLKLPRRTFANEVEIREETASLALIDVKRFDVFVDECYQSWVVTLERDDG